MDCWPRRGSATARSHRPTIPTARRPLLDLERRLPAAVAIRTRARRRLAGVVAARRRGDGSNEVLVEAPGDPQPVDAIEMPIALDALHRAHRGKRAMRPASLPSPRWLRARADKVAIVFNLHGTSSGPSADGYRRADSSARIAARRGPLARRAGGLLSCHAESANHASHRFRTSPLVCNPGSSLHDQRKSSLAPIGSVQDAGMTARTIRSRGMLPLIRKGRRSTGACPRAKACRRPSTARRPRRARAAQGSQ